MNVLYTGYAGDLCVERLPFSRTSGKEPNESELLLGQQSQGFSTDLHPTYQRSLFQGAWAPQIRPKRPNSPLKAALNSPS